MKRNSFIGVQRAILILVVIAAGLSGQAYCRTDEVALLIQQSPANGGTVSPDVGVHSFGLDTEVTLTAIARPGYQFVYWLGDVADPTANRTVAYLDTPKIIIAVFKWSEYELLVPLAGIKSSPVGGIIPSTRDYGRRGYTGGGRKRPHKLRWPQWPELKNDEFPVPEKGDDKFPVPNTPEPATAVLLALGTLLASRRGLK